MSLARRSLFSSVVCLLTVPALHLAGCGSSSAREGFGDAAPATEPPLVDPFLDAGNGAPPDPARDPETCEEAATTRSYVGCDYWPTVTGNGVWSVFDYTVVVSNTGKTPANVTVTGPNGFSGTATVAPGALEKIYLPWVPALKGPDFPPGANEVAPLPASVVARGGAYHLVSSSPVVVFQFNALEYRGKGGPPGKTWASCPQPNNCFSYSNDASLLLPSTAWTGNYRVSGIYGSTEMNTYVVVTAAKDGTGVTLTLGPNGKVLAGGDVQAADANGTVQLTLNAGDAAEIVSAIGSEVDLSGALVQATAPVQVITGVPCINIPRDKVACDHVEESVVPAEALGKRYAVTTPTSPNGGRGLHVVRFYGNRAGTKLTYKPGRPKDCPETLEPGQVVTCGPVDLDILVEGTEEFGIAGFQVGSSVYDPTMNDGRGDPSQTTFASTEQFRTSYVFLAPDDYDISYAVVVGPEDAKPVLDGTPITGFVPLDGELGVWRATLGPGNNGGHALTSSKPVGLQVMGYGQYTSYQYPGGLNLKLIAPPPPPPR